MRRESGEKQISSRQDMYGEREVSEFKLTPEQRERVLERVQNINERGVAFTHISVSREGALPEDVVANVLHQGLLSNKRDEEIPINMKKWKEEFIEGTPSGTLKDSTQARSTRDSTYVFFNIVGRGKPNEESAPSGQEADDLCDGEGEFKDDKDVDDRVSHFTVRYGYASHTGVAITFDLSGLKESVAVMEESQYMLKTTKADNDIIGQSYSPTSDILKIPKKQFDTWNPQKGYRKQIAELPVDVRKKMHNDGTIDKYGEVVVTGDIGFRAKGIIPRKRLTGIVLDIRHLYNKQIIEQVHKQELAGDEDASKMFWGMDDPVERGEAIRAYVMSQGIDVPTPNSLFAKIVYKMTHGLPEKQWLPIYDEYGNLLWPDELPNQEIVKNEEKSNV